MDNYTNLNSNTPELENLKKFNGYFDNRYLDPFINGYSFVFITKPQLFIEPNNPNQSDINNLKLAYRNMEKDPKFSKFLTKEVLSEEDKIIPRILSFNKTNETPSNFIIPFTNLLKNIDIQDINIDYNDEFQTKQGYRIQLPTHKTQSESSGSLNISFLETSNLTITKLLELWVNYISNISDGTFSANPEMIKQGRLDYSSSIYFFVLDPDGRTLKYWSKFTGCWPTIIPYSGIRFSKGQKDILEISTSFNYTIREDMNPEILEEFNIISLGLENYDASIFNDTGKTSIKNSNLLNLDRLKERVVSVNSILNNPDRSPLVIYEEEKPSNTNIDSTASRLILSFGDNSNTKSFNMDLFGPNFVSNQFFYDEI